jgi:hypothetical protein
MNQAALVAWPRTIGGCSPRITDDRFLMTFTLPSETITEAPWAINEASCHEPLRVRDPLKCSRRIAAKR